MNTLQVSSPCLIAQQNRHGFLFVLPPGQHGQTYSIFYLFHLTNSKHSVAVWVFLGARIEDFVYSKLDRTPPERPSNYQNLGSAMIEAGHDIGSSTTYGL